MASTSEIKTENFFAGGDGFDWDSYLFARPDYTLSGFYDILFSYHQSHSNEWDTAYDLGCGPGQVAAHLATKFNRVHGSDPNPFVINAAQKRFGSATVDFEVSSGEEIVNKDPARAATADFVTAAEVIPIMNTNAAVKAFAQLLKPNGTLACWFYGGPIYMSADAAEETVKEVQDLHHRITALSLAEHLPYKGTNFQYAATKIWKWLDNVPFDPSEWGNVRRVKWNTDQPLGFFKAEDLDFDLDAEFVNHVRPGEAVEERHDRDFWKKEDVNLVWVKAFIDANMPRTKDYKTEEVKGLFALMDSKMEGKKWDIAWPAVLLLATRK